MASKFSMFDYFLAIAEKEYEMQWMYVKAYEEITKCADKTVLKEKTAPDGIRHTTREV